jgi:hypothetical protein
MKDGIDVILERTFRQEDKMWVNVCYCVIVSARSKMINNIERFQSFLRGYEFKKESWTNIKLDTEQEEGKQ